MMSARFKRPIEGSRIAKRPADRTTLRYEPLEDRRLLATFTVNSLLDGPINLTDDTVTLREAIYAANLDFPASPGGPAGSGADEIVFDPSLSGGAILLISGALEITETLTIDASALAENVTIDGQQASSVLFFSAGVGDLTLRRLNVVNGNGGVANAGGGIRFSSTDSLSLAESTVSGNSIQGGSGYGGGIFTYDGSVTLTNSTVSGNVSGLGGGIWTQTGSVTLTNSTVSGNTAFSAGGGIWTYRGPVTLTNSTIFGNYGGTRGGGVYVRTSPINLNSPLTISNSIVAGNFAYEVGNDILRVDPDGMFVTHSLIGDNVGTSLFEAQTPDAEGNLIGDGGGGGVIDPLLGALADNGGPTLTHALSPISPAINAGDPAFSPPPEYDQRGSGFSRVVESAVDMGAVESERFGLVVDTIVDESDGDYSIGDLSLREAIELANLHSGPDEVVFASDLIGQTIMLDGTELEITDDLAITGSGADQLTIDADGRSRVFNVDDGDSGAEIDVAISDLTITGGSQLAVSGGGIFTNENLTLARVKLSGNAANSGGGAAAGTQASLTLVDSTLADNHSRGAGAALTNFGDLTVANSTLSGNTAESRGGGIYNLGSATLTNSTVSGNSAASSGGGIYNFGSLTLTNSIVANSASGGDVNTIYGTLVATGINLVEDGSVPGSANVINGDPKLGPLGDNGGPTPTHRLLFGSPAIDLGDNALALDPDGAPLTTDQRGVGFPRIVEGAVDLGAYEAGSATPLDGVTLIQAEDFSLRTDSGSHRWWRIDDETPGVGTFDNAIGPGREYLQALTLGGLDSSSANSIPAAPSVEFPINVAVTGAFALDVRAAGLSGTSDSLWVTIDGGTLTDAEGLATSSGAVQVNTNRTAVFAFLSAGVWNLPAGDHTVRVSMRESGTALDALVFEPQRPPTPIDGVTTIEAEQFGDRNDGANHRWWVIDNESAGVGAFTGATVEYLQALNQVGADDAVGNGSPADPTVSFPVDVPEERQYQVRVRAAGLSLLSDSLWFAVPGAVLTDAQGLATAGDAVRVGTNTTSSFEWLDAGRWTIPVGVQELVASMRESGTALDAIEISPISNPTPLDGVTLIQAEDYSARIPGGGHRWSVVDAETAGAGSFTFATGGTGDFVQALTTAGQDSNAANVAPADPTLRYEIEIAAPGQVALVLNAAGISGTSDSLWAEIEGATLVDAQGLATSGGAVRVVTNRSGKFERLDAGIWDVPAGDHAVRLSMRESGTAVDALVLEPRYPATPVSGTTVIEAEQFGDRNSASNHLWWVVNNETPGVGAVSGASGDYLQALNLAAADDTAGNAGPAKPDASYPIDVSEERVYRLRVRAAGLSPSSDSLWLGVPGATLVDSQGLAVSSGSLRVLTNSTGNLEWLDTGLWTIPVGLQEVVASLRESGTALDAIEIAPVSNPTLIAGATIIQAESYSARVPSSTHRWSVVDAETAGFGAFTGATGPNSDYLQALNLAGGIGGANIKPFEPTARFEIEVAAKGDYDLDARAAGLSGTTDSMWVRVVGAALANSQGRTVVDGSLLVGVGVSGAFASRNAGIWTLAPGFYTIEVAMRESGAALDALVVTPV